jgi:hypothetical protein
MDEKYIRNIFYYKNYYLDFFKTLDIEVKKKFNWTLKSNIWRIQQDFMKFGLNLAVIFLGFLVSLIRGSW